MEIEKQTRKLAVDCSKHGFEVVDKATLTWFEEIFEEYKKVLGMLIFPLLNDLSRKIIHIDMDAFFAAVEIRDNPKLRGKPVIIGSDPRQTGGRGVVSTCSYEARAFGVHSAMSSKEAYERCPQAVFISGNYEKYKSVGLQIRAIFKRYTDW
ncbi:DNA polymerase IV [Streptococcus pneumoniae]|nr:DNA polymerase IV [Streptococcus pneumoniae]